MNKLVIKNIKIYIILQLTFNIGKFVKELMIFYYRRKNQELYNKCLLKATIANLILDLSGAENDINDGIKSINVWISSLFFLKLKILEKNKKNDKIAIFF